MVLKRLLASRRAYADEYAVRVNRAVEVLAELAPADAVRTLRSEFAMSERQTHPPASSAPNRAPITHARNTRRLTRPGSPGNWTTNPGHSLGTPANTRHSPFTATIQASAHRKFLNRPLTPAAPSWMT